MDSKEKDRLRRFGAYVRELRKARGMTQQELSDKCGYSHRAAVSQIEGGKNEISIDRLPALATALGVEPSELFAAYDFERENSKDVNSALIDVIKGYLPELTPAQIEQVAAIVKVMHSQNKGGNT